MLPVSSMAWWRCIGARVFGTTSILVRERKNGARDKDFAHREDNALNGRFASTNSDSGDEHLARRRRTPEKNPAERNGASGATPWDQNSTLTRDGVGQVRTGSSSRVRLDGYFWLNNILGHITWTPTLVSTNWVTSTSHATLVSMYASSRLRCFCVTRKSIICRTACVVASLRFSL